MDVLTAAQLLHKLQAAIEVAKARGFDPQSLPVYAFDIDGTTFEFVGIACDATATTGPDIGIAFEMVDADATPEEKARIWRVDFTPEQVAQLRFTAGKTEGNVC